MKTPLFLICVVCVCVWFLLPIISNSFFRVGPISGQSSIAEATAKWRETGDAKEALKLMKGGTASASLEGIVLRALAKGSTYQQARTVRIPIRCFFFSFLLLFFFKFRKTFFSFLSFFLPFSVWDHVVHILCIRFSVHDRSAEYQLSKPLRPCVSEPDLEQGSCAIHTNYLCPWILWLFGSCICHKSIFNTGRVCYQIQGLEIVEISKKKYDDKCWNNEH